MNSQHPVSLKSRKLSTKLHSLILALPLIAGPALYAQTWQTTATGNTTWSLATWDTGLPVSGTSTIVNFFPGNTTLSSAASITATNDQSPNPFVVNQLNIFGTGPATSGSTLTINGNAIAFDGTSPQLNINGNYGGSGYTVNVANALTFNTPTAINFSNGGAIINLNGIWNGAGNVTFTGKLVNRPLSITGSAGNVTFTGDLILNSSGNQTVLQLNQKHNSLGANTATTQSVVVNTGTGVNVANGDAAYSQPQNFVSNGTGNAATNGAAVNVTGLNFGNTALGGLAVNSNTTIRVQQNNASQARAVTLTRGIVGTGDLTKTGNAWLTISALAGNVTWGGNAYSLFSGNLTIAEGVVQTPTVSNTLGSGSTQSVVVNSGAAFVHGSGDNAWTNPQNFVLNGFGTGYVVNGGSGLAAFSTPNAGFGSNTAGSLSIQTDSSVSVIRNTGRGNIGLSLQRGLFGSGNLTLQNLYGSNFGTMFVGNPSVSSVTTLAGTFNSFSGKVVVNNGILILTGSNALGNNTAGQVYLSGAGAFGSSVAADLSQSFLNRIANAPTSSGILALGVNTSNDLNFSTSPSLRLGSVGAFTYSGVLTPGSNGYRLGGGGGTLTVSSNLTASTALLVGGTVALTGPGNTFNGGITIAGINTAADHVARLNYTNGTGVLPSNPLTFAGIGGTFAYATPTNANATSQSMGNITFSEGVGSVTATTGNSTTFGNSTLTLTGLTRTAGAAGTLQTVNGANGTSNKIVVTGLATGFVDKGIFFNSSNYAYNDATGFLRAPVYGTDSGFVTSGTTASVASAAHQQITGAITAQNTATFTTLRINAGSNLTLASGQTLTVDGILKAGGTAVTIAGGSGIQASSGSELVINNAEDITLSTTPILDNGTSSLTKFGAGTVTMSSAGNTYAGGTTVNQGTLLVASTATGGLADFSPVVVNGGTYSSNVADTIGALTLRNGVVSGLAAISPSSANLQNGAVNTILAGSGAVTKTTEGYVYLSSNNTYSGGTTVSAGSIGLIGSGSFGTGMLTISGGRVDLGGKTITNTLGPITGGSLLGGTVINNGGTYDLQNGTISATLAGTNGLNKSSAGSLTLSGNNSYTGPTTITGGSLILGATALPLGGLGSSTVVLSNGSSLNLSGLSASTISLANGLSGNGTVDATGKTLAIAGTFTPGAMTILGNLTFDPATQTTFVASTTAGVSTALAVSGSITNAGNLTISPAPSFAFAGNQTFTFVSATGGITPGYGSVSVNAVPLTQAPAGVWSATDSNLIYTYTENTATLTVASAVVYTPLQLWRNDKFGTTDNTGVAANTYDADGDGIVNLLEYALNGNPNGADTSILPKITGTGPLKLTFYRNGDYNITYIVEARDDLVTGAWTEIYNSFGTTYTPGMFEVTDSGQVGNKRFMRLRVTAP